MNLTLSRCAFVVVLLLPFGRPDISLAQVPQAPHQALLPAAASALLPIAPDSPRAAIRSFLQTSHEGRWDAAARCLSLGDDYRDRGTELAKRLYDVIEHQYLLDPASISAAPEGRLDDDLPPDQEEIGQVSLEATTEPLRLVRGPEAGGVFWRVAPASVARIDVWYDELPERWIRHRITAAGMPFLLRMGPCDIRLWQWIALPLIALVSSGMGLLLHTVAKPLMEHLTARTRSVWDDRLVASFGPPVSLALALACFFIGGLLTQLPRPAVLFIGSLLRSGLVFALFWALWRSSAVMIAWGMSRPWAANNASVRSLLSIGSNISRAVIIGIGTLAMVAAFGYPIGTMLAGLGIGGLAIAFGAQKTIENLFGSVSLAVDQPFRVGDFVKVEDFVGTVEDIGLRSTRFRTLDRTLVSIPNGKLADQRLESLAVRDRMRLATTLSLTYETTRTQMHAVLNGCELVLRTHPHIWPHDVVVKFKELGQRSLEIEMMAWFDVPTWAEFLQCREEVLLGFMGVVEDVGTRFAFPTKN